VVIEFDRIEISIAVRERSAYHEGTTLYYQNYGVIRDSAGLRRSTQEQYHEMWRSNYYYLEKLRTQMINFERTGDLNHFGVIQLQVRDALTQLQGTVSTQFRKQQTEFGGSVAAEEKQTLRHRLSDLEEELNWHLAGQYGVKKPRYPDWLKTHRPFHWFIDFHGIMGRGGFDVIISNPPYVVFA